VRKFLPGDWGKCRRFPSARGDWRPPEEADQRQQKGCDEIRARPTDDARQRGGSSRAAHRVVLRRVNGVDPQAWLADVLRRIAGHPAARLYELLPWHWQSLAKEAAAA
jgi:hypothetical protein